MYFIKNIDITEDNSYKISSSINSSPIYKVKFKKDHLFGS